MSRERYVDYKTEGHESPTFAALSLVVTGLNGRVVRVLAAAPGGFREVPLLPSDSLPSEQEAA